MTRISQHTNGRGSASTAAAATTPPRRMSPEQRREQLERVALEVVAEHGHSDLSLDEVAERAGVTRNLIYHYFPRGRADLVIAAVHRSGRELSEGWVTDPEIPHAQRLAMNFARIIDHAEQPSAAWRAMRHSRLSPDPEVQRHVNEYRDMVLEGMALNNFGTAEPPPLAKLAIKAFLAYAEEALDEWREQGLDRNAVMALLASTLSSTADAAIELTVPAP
jgi:AcrR family transcriptional regulator